MIATAIGVLISLTACITNEECVCDNSDNLNESDAKDSGVSIYEVCEAAKKGDETCRIE